MAHQRMAVVNKDGTVVNTIVYDPDATWSPPEGCILVDASEGGGIGDIWVWNGKTFVPPIVKPPLSPAWWRKQ